MNAQTRPGLAIYSEEWMSEVATTVAEPLRAVVRALCEEYQIGDSTDPNTIARIIERELSEQCSRWEHQIEKGDSSDLEWVQPDGLEFDRVSGYWYFQADGYAYAPEEIVARRKKEAA